MNTISPVVRNMYVLLWIICLMNMGVWLVIGASLENDVLIFFAFLNMMIFIVTLIGIMEIGDDHIVGHLLDGENRQMRKKQRKILKLEAKQKYIEQEKEKNEQINVLNCKIHTLELEIKEGTMICKFCGAKMFRKACYCSKCGEEVM